MREQIINAIKRELEGMVVEGTEIIFNKVNKNNGVQLQAVLMKKPGQTVVPTIYIDKIIDDVATGKMKMREAAEQIISIDRNAQKNGLGDMGKIFNKENILDKVVYQVINREKNARKVEGVPHKKLLDLAVVYRAELLNNGDERGYMLVTYEHMAKLGIGIDELDEAARRNTERDGFVVKSMRTMMAELMGIREEVIPYDETNLFVMTSASKLNGAAIMLYENFFEELAEKFDDDLFVFPCSIHEVLTMPASIVDKEYASNMVKEINASEVAYEDILSDTVYRYSRAEKNLQIA